MKKTVLIPTDFTIQSLNILKTFLNQNPNNQYHIILLHGINIGDSIRDLLFFSKNKQLQDLANDAFIEAFEVIKNKFDSQINSIKIDFFTGSNQAAFNNFIEGNEINQIINSNYKLKFNTSKSFDFSRYFNKCKAENKTIEIANQLNIPEKGKLAEVFFNQVSVG